MITLELPAGGKAEPAHPQMFFHELSTDVELGHHRGEITGRVNSQPVGVLMIEPRGMNRAKQRRQRRIARGQAVFRRPPMMETHAVGRLTIQTIQGIRHHVANLVDRALLHIHAAVQFDPSIEQRPVAGAAGRPVGFVKIPGHPGAAMPGQQRKRDLRRQQAFHGPQGALQIFRLHAIHPDRDTGNGSFTTPRAQFREEGIGHADIVTHLPQHLEGVSLKHMGLHFSANDPESELCILPFPQLFQSDRRPAISGFLGHHFKDVDLRVIPKEVARRYQGFRHIHSRVARLERELHRQADPLGFPHQVPEPGYRPATALRRVIKDRLDFRNTEGLLIPDHTPQHRMIRQIMPLTIEEVASLFQRSRLRSGHEMVVITVKGDVVEPQPRQVAQVFLRLFQRIAGYIHGEIDVLADPAALHLRLNPFFAPRTKRIELRALRQHRPRDLELPAELLQKGVGRVQYTSIVVPEQQGLAIGMPNGKGKRWQSLRLRSQADTPGAGCAVGDNCAAGLSNKMPHFRNRVIQHRAGPPGGFQDE